MLGNDSDRVKPTIGVFVPDRKTITGLQCDRGVFDTLDIHDSAFEVHDQLPMLKSTIILVVSIVTPSK